MSREHIGRKALALAAVACAAALSGWSALGGAGGVTFAVALTVGVAIALFGGRGTSCRRR